MHLPTRPTCAPKKYSGSPDCTDSICTIPITEWFKLVNKNLQLCCSFDNYMNSSNARKFAKLNKWYLPNTIFWDNANPILLKFSTFKGPFEQT